MLLSLSFFLLIQAAPPPSGATVSGRVVDFADGAPVPYAHVLLRQTGGDSFSATADVNGVYEIQSLPASLYTAIAGRAGFMSSDLRDRFDEPLSIKLSEGQIVKNIEFRLKRPGVIAGTVTGSDGDPVDQATVFAMQKVYRRGRMELAPRRPIQTNDRGEFRLRDLPPGTYYVRAYKLGYSGAGSPPLAAVIYPNAERMEDAQGVRVKPGEVRANIDFLLRDAAMFSVSGHLLDPDGQAVGNTRIAAAPEVLGGQGGVAQTSPDGTFQINYLLPGFYRLTGTATVASLGGAISFNRRVDVSGDLRDVTVRVNRGVTVKGKVQAEGGDLPERLSVSLFSRGATGNVIASLPTATKPDGTFEIAHVQPGVYDFSVDSVRPQASSEPSPFFLQKATVKEQDITDANLAIPDDASSLDILATIDFAGGRINGNIADADGKAVVTNVVLTAADPKKRLVDRYFRQTKSKRDGTYTISGVIPGDYLIAAWPGDDPGQVLDPEVFSSLEKQFTRIKVERSGLVSVDVSVTSAIRAIADAHTQ